MKLEVGTLDPTSIVFKDIKKKGDQESFLPVISVHTPTAGGGFLGEVTVGGRPLSCPPVRGVTGSVIGVDTPPYVLWVSRRLLTLWGLQEKGKSLRYRRKVPMCSRPLVQYLREVLRPQHTRVGLCVCPRTVYSHCRVSLFRTHRLSVGSPLVHYPLVHESRTPTLRSSLLFPYGHEGFTVPCLQYPKPRSTRCELVCTRSLVSTFRVSHPST